MFQACSDTPGAPAVDPIDPGLLNIAQDIANVDDRSTGGNSNFVWLAPLSGNGAPDEPFGANLNVVVEICALDGSALAEHCGSDALPASAQDDHYQAMWDTNRDNVGETFRVTVYINDEVNGLVEMGSLEIELEQGGPQNAGRNIPVKFWIGTEVDECVTAARCNLGTVVSNDGGDVLVEDETGTTIAFVDFDPGWSPGGIDRTVTIDCRADTFVPPNGPLNTVLDQIPLYCSFTLDPALAPQEEFTSPQRVGICEVITDIHGEPVLGKQSAGGPFELLPKVFAGDLLTGCDVPGYPGVAAADGIFGTVATRLASLLAFMGPQPLRALRDGGVGGSVRSFSDINPVIPATISGTLTDAFGIGRFGVTVTLSDGRATETDQGGRYSFGTLDGGSYTVTVDTNDPSFPQFESLLSNTAVVDVTGSGDFVADFQSNSLFAFVAGNEDQSQAEAACVANFGGHLASIHSQEEDDYISRVVDPNGVGNITPWIGAIPNTNSGLFDAGAAGTYAWIDGTPWDYSNWRLLANVQEPNSSGPAPAGVQFWPNTNGAFSGWNDVSAGINLLSGYVCSVPAS